MMGFWHCRKYCSYGGTVILENFSPVLRGNRKSSVESGEGRACYGPEHGTQLWQVHSLVIAERPERFAERLHFLMLLEARQH